jgi:Mn-dependent DtxR family transcriptional regulator
MESPINYPPKEIANPIFGKPDYELIILWMLNNNESCSWADLKKVIKPSTLSLYLKELKEYGYVDHSEYNEYRITSQGSDRFYEVSQLKSRKRKVNYPPLQMLHAGRNYEDWILWMAYNNNFLQWSDFLVKPVSINQSSLSKALNNLMDSEREYVQKDDDKKYRITPLGKSEYSRMLRKYELDRQSILDSESERIQDLTEKTIKFFEGYNIEDDDLRFRFLNNMLKLPYGKVNTVLTDEMDFYKILLFISLNHPKQFPNHISREEFAKKYDIEAATLDFFILQIVDKCFSEQAWYPIKFFKLEDEGFCYFLQEDDKLEKMLKATVEEKITKLTYLNRLYEPKPDFSFNLNLINKSILDDVCGMVFDEGLRNSLEKLLPSYIQHLAFKFESKKKYHGPSDKLKGLIWREVKNLKVLEIDLKGHVSIEDKIVQIEDQIKSDPKNIELYRSKENLLLYFNRFSELDKMYDQMMSLFPEEQKDLLIKKAYILKENREIERGLEIIERLLDEEPDNQDLLKYKAYWLSYLDRKEEAISVIRNLINIDPKNPSLHDTYGEILMTFGGYEKAVNAFEKVLDLGKKEWYLFQTYIKYGICHKNLGHNSIAIEALTRGKQVIKTSKIKKDEKDRWLAIAEPFIQELKELENT